MVAWSGLLLVFIAWLQTALRILHFRDRLMGRPEDLFEFIYIFRTMGRYLEIYLNSRQYIKSQQISRSISPSLKRLYSANVDSSLAWQSPSLHDALSWTFRRFGKVTVVGRRFLQAYACLNCLIRPCVHPPFERSSFRHCFFMSIFHTTADVSASFTA